MTEQQDHLPEGCECALTFFVASDETGLEIKVTIAGLPALPKFTEENALVLIEALGADIGPLAGMAPDWRFMTRAEIADYKLREDEDA